MSVNHPINAPAGPGRVLWSTEEIAVALGWRRRDGAPNTRRVLWWLRRRGACSQHGRHYYAGHSQLRRVFGEEADRVIASLSDE